MIRNRTKFQGEPTRHPTMRCPTCGGICYTLKTAQIAPSYREMTYICRNNACGHVFVVGLEVVRTIDPSALPPAEIARLQASLRADASQEVS